MGDAQKGSHDHFLIKEILDQKATVVASTRQDPLLLKQACTLIDSAANIFLIGCGTSYNACLAGADIFLYTSKKHVNPMVASEFARCISLVDRETLIIAPSQSGETADVLAAITLAKSKGAKVLSIVNVQGSTLSRVSDLTLHMNVGPEVSVLSTKSYSAQIAILMLLAHALNENGDMGKEIIRDAAEKMAGAIDTAMVSMPELAKKVKDAPSMFILGRDSVYPVAKEAALKIKEVTYIHAESFQGGELKHGPIALVREGTPVIVMANDNTRKATISNAEELKARGAFIIGIDNKSHQVYDCHVPYKKTQKISSDLFCMIAPVQVLSYYLALERDCDPDKPRNLAKSVTVL